MSWKEKFEKFVLHKRTREALIGLNVFCVVLNVFVAFVGKNPALSLIVAAMNGAVAAMLIKQYLADKRKANELVDAVMRGKKPVDVQLP